jgi:predicted Fe-Mo cluster-binding NifX family protein
MKLLISATGPDVTAQVDPRFGRAPSFVLVDTETNEWSAYVNPGAGAGHGAGIEAARFAIELGAQAVLTGATGPNAFRTLSAGNVSVFPVNGGRVADAVEQWKAGSLAQAGGATAAAHAGFGPVGGGSRPGAAEGR